MVRTHLPVAMEVRELVERLLGREVAVVPSAPLVPGPYLPTCVGVYVDDAHRVTSVVCADLSLAAHLSACLGLQPASAARSAVSERVLDELLEETFRELLNVCACLWSAPGTAHTRLFAMYSPGRPLPADARTRALVLGRRLDLTVNVVGYGSGRLSMVLSPA